MADAMSPATSGPTSMVYASAERLPMVVLFLIDSDLVLCGMMNADYYNRDFDS